MRFPKNKNKKRFNLLKRKERLNKNFIWTNEAVQNILTLNTELEKLQVELAQQMRSAYELFKNLEKSGMPFLHGFKVIGQIDFEKTDLDELYNLEKPSRGQRKIIEKWEDLQYYSSNEIDAWQLVFDSETADLLPLSKIRLIQKEKCWDLDLPDCEDTEFCSFLNDFINYDTIFCFEDLAELTIKDFGPVVKVVLNYNTSEIDPFFTCYPYRDADQDNIYNILAERKHVLNKAFSWNEKNIQKILEVNSWVWKRHEELKHYISELNSAFNFFSQTDPEFKNYSIEGQIEYHGSEANDVATLEMQKAMTKYAGFHFWTLSVDNDRPEMSDSIHEDGKLNWNFEVYRHHFSEDQQKIKFHYLMHSLFVDDHIYSFEDLVRMREEDFKVCLEINWWPD